MKDWKIEEFVAECEALSRNPYTYDFDRMPAGTCNGHNVEAYKGSIASVVVDGCIRNLGVISDRCPQGSIFHSVAPGKCLGAVDYARWLVERPVQKKREYDPNVYGYVNGEPVYSADEYVFKCRGFGPIESDEELIAFAEKASHGWLDSGHRQTFTGYYLGEYALDEPKRSLTDKEYKRLKELQAEARAAAKAADDARRWRHIRNEYYADNSVEEVWEDKDGVQKTVMIVGPHGDAC